VRFVIVDVDLVVDPEREVDGDVTQLRHDLAGELGAASAANCMDAHSAITASDITAATRAIGASRRRTRGDAAPIRSPTVGDDAQWHLGNAASAIHGASAQASRARRAARRRRSSGDQAP